MGFRSTVATLEPEEQRHRVSMGYTCFCGERVVVYRLRSRRENMIPHSKTVTCPNGHVATFLARHFALLDDWAEGGSS